MWITGRRVIPWKHGIAVKREIAGKHEIIWNHEVAGKLGITVKHREAWNHIEAWNYREIMCSGLDFPKPKE